MSTLRGDIEGLRAVAVLLVLAYHLQVNGFAGGFAGVDVFFVISGFLITSQLLREVERTGRVSLTQFYARRARRLLPAATVVLFGTAVAGFLVLPRADRTDLATDVASAAFYVINWTLAARSVDYLAEDAAVSPLQHYWSLAVEEQFYLVAPLLLLGLGALATRRRWRQRLLVGAMLAALALASFAWSVSWTAASPQEAYFVTTTRAWELAVGAVAACAVPVLTRLRAPAAEAMALTGAALVAASALLATTATPWPGSAAALPVVGTALVVAAGCALPRTVVGRALGWRPLQWIGGLSYSIYLWHWPLIVLSQQLRPGMGWRRQLVLAGVSVLLAHLSKRFLEDPIRFRPSLSSRPRRALALGGAGMSVCALAACAVFLSAPRLVDGPAPQVPGGMALAQAGTSTPAPPPNHQAAAGNGPIHPDPATAPADVPAYYGDDCQAPVSATQPRTDCVYGTPDGATTVAVLGDSKMGQWMPAVERVAEREGWRLELYLKSGCSFNPAPVDYPECAAWNANVLQLLAARADAVDVVLTSGLARGDAAVAGYVHYWQRLQEIAQHVVVLTDSPTPRLDRPRAEETVYECVDAHPQELAACSFPENRGVGTPALEAAADAGPAVELIDLNPWVCPAVEGRCPPVVGGVIVYRQGSHITATYAGTLAPVLHRQLLAAGVASADPMASGA